MQEVELGLLLKDVLKHLRNGDVSDTVLVSLESIVFKLVTHYTDITKVLNLVRLNHLFSSLATFLTLAYLPVMEASNLCNCRNPSLSGPWWGSASWMWSRASSWNLFWRWNVVDTGTCCRHSRCFWRRNSPLSFQTNISFRHQVCDFWLEWK